MNHPVESAPNIGRELGQRLRAVGIDSREALEQVGDATAFFRLAERFPEDACSHTRLALAGAVRGVRWTELPAAERDPLTAELRAHAERSVGDRKLHG
jgi:DNA transformation protein